MRTAETVLNVIRDRGKKESATAGLTTGEPDAVKAARPVRRGADGKVLRYRGVTRWRPTLTSAPAEGHAGMGTERPGLPWSGWPRSGPA